MKSGGAPAPVAGVVSKAPSAPAGAPVAGKPPDGGLSMAAIKDVVGAIDAAPGSAKIRSVVRLADAMGQSLQIEHINHFLRALKKRVVERAQQDGVQVPQTRTAAPLTLTKATTGAGAQPPAGAKPATPGGVSAVKAPAPALNGKAAGIAKVPSAVGKTPPAAVQKPKPPQPPAQPPARPPSAAAPAASPPASPPPSGEDPLFALIGELGNDPVCVDGALNDARLGDVLKRLWDGIARKPKDWIAGWQAMKIPVDKQGEALQKFMNMAFMHPEDSERAPMVTAELVKSHKVKMRSVEEVLVAFGSNLDGILAINENAWHVYSYFLVNVFPKPSTAGWGWSRVGWSWQSWWKFTEQCIQTLEASRASDVLCMILRLIQEREGQPLAEVQGWADSDRLQRVVTKLSDLGACEASEAAEKLAAQGVAASA